MNSGLAVRDVSKSWGDHCVLDQLGLEVGAGEIVAVLGESGCGKTTLLRIIAGLERADEGTVSIGGIDVTSSRPAARKIGMVFQHHALLPHLSVRDNIGFALTSGRGRSPDAAGAIARAANLAGCNDFLDRSPTTLSGGERQRVALARAVVKSPGLVLLDEPLSSLDLQDRVALRTDLRQSLVASGSTVVHVTHDQAEAFALGDRVAVVGGGRVLQIGSADDVYDRPASLAVASLVGSPQMNVFPVRPATEATDAAHHAGPFALEFTENLRGIAHHSSLVAGLRASHVHPVSVDDPNGVTGRVVAVEVVDEIATLHVDIGGDVVRSVVERSGRPSIGDTMALVADATRFHLFDASTGVAIHHPSDLDPSVLHSSVLDPSVLDPSVLDPSVLGPFRQP